MAAFDRTAGTLTYLLHFLPKTKKVKSVESRIIIGKTAKYSPDLQR